MPSLIEHARAVRKQAEAEQKAVPPPVPAGRLALEQFAVSGRMVVIFSDVIGCEIVMAADNARVSGETRPVYRARELMGLSEWTPEGLRLLHETKVAFGAEIEPETTPAGRLVLSL